MPLREQRSQEPAASIVPEAFGQGVLRASCYDANLLRCVRPQQDTQIGLRSPGDVTEKRNKTAIELDEPAGALVLRERHRLEQMSDEHRKEATAHHVKEAIS